MKASCSEADLGADNLDGGLRGTWGKSTHGRANDHAHQPSAPALIPGQGPAGHTTRAEQGPAWPQAHASQRPQAMKPFQPWVPAPLGDEGTGQPAGTLLGAPKKQDTRVGPVCHPG